MCSGGWVIAVLAIGWHPSLGTDTLTLCLGVQNTVETRLDRVDRTLQAHDERLSHLEAMCFRLSHQDSGQSRNNSHSELSHSGHSLGNRTTSR